MLAKFLTGLVGLILAGTATAQSTVEIDREVFLERSAERDGRTQRTLEPAVTLRRGDQVVLMLAWRTAQERPFFISSRVPHTLAFRHGGAAAPEVSVDGGRSWGALESLRIGGRRATSGDVTNVRWNVADPRGASGNGVFTYSAIVR